MSALPEKIISGSVCWIVKTDKKQLKNHTDFFAIYNYGIVPEETEIIREENCIRLKLKEKGEIRLKEQQELEFCIRFTDESNCYCKCETDFWKDPNEEHEAEWYSSPDGRLIHYEDENEAIYITLK